MNSPTEEVSMKQRRYINGLLFIAAVSTSSAYAEIISDFNSGTVQGWTESNPLQGGSFGGSLFAPSTGGNPGGYLLATDSVSGGGSLAARAPAPLSGDLTVFQEVSWDVLSFLRLR